MLRQERGVNWFHTLVFEEKLAMSLVIATSVAPSPGMIATIIVGVLVFSHSLVGVRGGFANLPSVLNEIHVICAAFFFRSA
jgi:hypothetical protein